MIGRMVMPGRGMSKHRKLMPCCGLPPEEFYADSFTSEADKHGA